MPTPEELAAAEAAVAASQQTTEQIAAVEEAARAAAAAASVAEKVIYTPEELSKITPTDIDLDRVDPAYRPIVENTIRDYKELQKDHTKKSQASKDAEREAKYWRDVALKNVKEEKTEPVIEPSVPVRPKLDQFETVEEYEDSLLAWHDKKRTVESQAETVKRRVEEATRKFEEKSAKLRAELEDFDEVIKAPVFTPAMKIALLNADNGPVVAYYLGRPENRQIVEKIAELPVERQIYELGKLETQLLVKKPNKVPGAPAPITPVGIGGGGTTVDTSKMSDEEWFKYDQQQKILRLKKKTGG